MKKENFREQAISLLAGGYDLHTHSSPSHVERVVDDFELLADAADLGMAGVMIKNHYEPTGSRAALVNLLHPEYAATAYGGVVLNHPVGGLNPYAVESAMRLGAVMVWMPTRDSAHSLSRGNMPGDFFSRPGIGIFDDSGKLRSAINEIIDIVSMHEGVLATGHLSLEESVVLCRECIARKVKVVLTHPEWQRTVVPLDVQKNLAHSGVKIEKCWLNIAEGDCDAEYMANTIREIGPENVMLATDCGKRNYCRPAEGMLGFLETLLGLGFSGAWLHTMTHEVPASLLSGFMDFNVTPVL